MDLAAVWTSAPHAAIAVVVCVTSGIALGAMLTATSRVRRPADPVDVRAHEALQGLYRAVHYLDELQFVVGNDDFGGDVERYRVVSAALRRAKGVESRLEPPERGWLDRVIGEFATLEGGLVSGHFDKVDRRRTRRLLSDHQVLVYQLGFRLFMKIRPPA